MMRWIRPALLLAVMLILAGTGDAAPRGRRATRKPRSAPSAAAPARVPNIYRERGPASPVGPGYWSMSPELYPQWYGGFHGRMLQNYGYPPGDLGIRGMAW